MTIAIIDCGVEIKLNAIKLGISLISEGHTTGCRPGRIGNRQFNRVIDLLIKGGDRQAVALTEVILHAQVNIADVRCE